MILSETQIYTSRAATLVDADAAVSQLRSRIEEMSSLRDEAEAREADVAIELVDIQVSQTLLLNRKAYNKRYAQEKLAEETRRRQEAESVASENVTKMQQVRAEAQAAVAEITSVERASAQSAENRATNEATLRSDAERRLDDAMEVRCQQNSV